jgi:hypothetical protein
MGSGCYGIPVIRGAWTPAEPLALQAPSRFHIEECRMRELVSGVWSEHSGYRKRQEHGWNPEGCKRFAGSYRLRSQQAPNSRCIPAQQVPELPQQTPGFSRFAFAIRNHPAQSPALSESAPGIAIGDLWLSTAVSRAPIPAQYAAVMSAAPVRSCPATHFRPPVRRSIAAAFAAVLARSSPEFYTPAPIPADDPHLPSELVHSASVLGSARISRTDTLSDSETLAIVSRFRILLPTK